MAARWGLLAWEDPRVRNRAVPFWSDVPMVMGKAEPEGERVSPPLTELVRESGATFTGLRLRDRTVILQVKRRGKVEHVRLNDWDAFDPARDGLMLMAPLDGLPPTSWARMHELLVMMTRRKRSSGVPRSSSR